MHIGLVTFLILFLAGITVGAGLRSDERRKRRRVGLGVLMFLAVIAAQIALVYDLGMTLFGLALLDAVIGLVGAAAGMTIPYVVRLYRQERADGMAASRSPAMTQDREMVLDMLRKGKVSGEQAADLLKALGPSPGSADRLPLTISVIGSVVGAILVVVGFMLPWNYVRVAMPFLVGMKGYQAGYNVGYVGWIVLIAGILPAILVCIQGLDKHLRQGLLRMVIGGLGSAFVIVMLLRSPQGVGLWVAALGFALQLLTAFRQVGLAGSSGG